MKNHKKQIYISPFIKIINILLFVFGVICIHFLYESKINSIKTSICLITKEEIRYIKEFVDYYRKLNIKKIFLYDNNDINGEYLENILSNYIKLDFIEIINYRGRYKPQFQAYNHCYFNKNKDFNWVAFYDADEYLYINLYTDINKFLSLSKFRKCLSILINWKYYGDNEKLYYEPRPLQERFTKPFYFKNFGERNKIFYSAGKTIVRTGLNLTWNLFPHYLKNTPICRPNGKELKNYFSPPQYSSAFIRHYATKSTEEFIERIIRGTVNSKSYDISQYIRYKINSYSNYL